MYLKNTFQNANSFERATRLALRYNDHPIEANQFVNTMIEELNIFKNKNDRLPESFTEKAVRDLYLKLSSSSVELEQPTQEFVLYMLKNKGLYKEAFDFASQQKESELADYYKSEALLHMDLKKGQSYLAAVDSVVSKEYT